MTPEEAKDLFSDAYEGALTEVQLRAFETTLDENSELKAEFQELVELLGEAQRLTVPEGEVPNLLPGVQKKLRERSRGRYYRDRFSAHKQMSWMPVALAFALLALVGLAYAGLHYVQELEAAGAAAGE